MNLQIDTTHGPKSAPLLDAAQSLPGNGSRLFDYYKKEGIKFVGVERSENHISGSRDKKFIINLSLSDQNFVYRLKSELERRGFMAYDTIVMFGGVVNGLIDEQMRVNAWRNLGLLTTSDVKLIVSTLIDPTWYKSQVVGRTVQIIPQVPYQYYYSEKELVGMVQKSGLTLVETYIDYLPYGHCNLHLSLKANSAL